MNLFAYGTLKDPDAVRFVLDDNHRDIRATPSVYLRDHGILEAGYKFIIPYPGKSVKGVLIDGLTEDDLPRLDEYENASYGMYTRVKVSIDIVSTVEAYTYIAGPNAPFWRE